MRDVIPFLLAFVLGMLVVSIARAAPDVTKQVFCPNPETTLHVDGRVYLPGERFTCIGTKEMHCHRMDEQHGESLILDCDPAGEIVEVYAVPEPGQVSMLLAGSAMLYVLWRLKK